MRLNQPGKAGVPISYRLRQSGGGWKIIDVFYRNSISQIATRRADFAGVHLLINQMPTQSVLGHQVRSAMYGTYALQMVPVSVHRDASVSQALAFERPVLEYEPGCKASLDIQYLADWVLDSMGR